MNKREFESRLAEHLRALPPRTTAIFEGFATAVLNGDVIEFSRVHGSPWGIVGDRVDLGVLWQERAEDLQAWLDEPEYAQSYAVSGDSMKH